MNEQEEMERLRRERFQVDCESSSAVKGEIKLTFTQNGYQWKSIHCNKDEAVQIINALQQDFMEKNYDK
jgi:N-acetyl-anhydromuramyl-L-alanine amidase AmpD